MFGTQPPDCGVMLTSSHCPPLGSHSGNGSGVEYSVLLTMAPAGGADGTAPDADASADGEASADTDVDGTAAAEFAAGDDGSDAFAVGVAAPAASGELLPFRSKPR